MVAANESTGEWSNRSGHRHIRERCTCDDPTCRRWLCVLCDDWIDRARKVIA